jgi:broad specificity phosphatase PhoE
MRIEVYRHAQSVSNAGGRTDDPAGIRLTPTGHGQARALARSLRHAPDIVLFSRFMRTAQTARPIHERFPRAHADLWPIEEFTYLAPESCVGTTWFDREPRITAYWSALDPDHVDGPGAESFRTMLERARVFLEQLPSLKARNVVAISHGQFMQAAKLVAQRPELDAREAMREFIRRQETRPFANCGRMLLGVRDGAAMVVDS